MDNHKQPPEVFCKKRCSWKFRKIRSKTSVPESLCLSKKRLWHRCFTVNFAKFLRTPFFIKHLWWLLLIIIYTWSNSLDLGFSYTFNLKCLIPLDVSCEFYICLLLNIGVVFIFLFLLNIFLIKIRNIVLSSHQRCSM